MTTMLIGTCATCGAFRTGSWSSVTYHDPVICDSSLAARAFGAAGWTLLRDATRALVEDAGFPVHMAVGTLGARTHEEAAVVRAWIPQWVDDLARYDAAYGARVAVLERLARDPVAAQLASRGGWRALLRAEVTGRT